MSETSDHNNLEERVLKLEQLVSDQKQRLEQLELLTAGRTFVKPLSQQPDSPPKVYKPITEPEINREHLEAMIGGTWLNRIGVLAFVLGIGFFLKYAFDNNWIGPTGRVALGLITGIILLGAGDITRQKHYEKFAQGITGGGIAILYLSIFAAFQTYHLITQIPAFGLMALVTTTAVLLAVRYNSMTIAVMGVTGGFLTPFLLSTGTVNTLGLFTYIGILDVGILATAYYRNWRPLNYLSYVFTQIWIFAWLTTTTTPEIWVRQTVFSVFFTVFALLSFFHNILHKKLTQSADLLLIFLNASIFFGLSYFNLVDKYQAYLGLFAALMGAVYFGLGYLALQVNKEDRNLVLTFLGVSLVFLTVAIPIQLKGSWITMGWAAEAAVLTWLGFKYDSVKTRFGSWLVFLLVIVRLLGIDTQQVWLENYLYAAKHGNIYTPLLNMKTLTFLVSIAAFFLANYFYYRNRDRVVSEEKHALTAFPVVANILILWLFSTEIICYFDSLTLMLTPGNGYPELGYGVNEEAKQLTLSAVWAVYSIFLVALGILKKVKVIRLFAMLLFGITILKVFLFDLSSLDTIYRILSFLILGVILILVSFLYQVFKDRIAGIIEDDKK